MKIIYDDHKETYIIALEHPETVTCVNTNDITEAKEEFIRCMTRLFNNAVCAKLKD